MSYRVTIELDAPSSDYDVLGVAHGIAVALMQEGASDEGASDFVYKRIDAEWEAA